MTRWPFLNKTLYEGPRDASSATDRVLPEWHESRLMKESEHDPQDQPELTPSLP